MTRKHIYNCDSLSEVDASDFDDSVSSTVISPDNEEIEGETLFYARVKMPRLEEQIDNRKKVDSSYKSTKIQFPHEICQKFIRGSQSIFLHFSYGCSSYQNKCVCCRILEYTLRLSKMFILCS
jgi:hypothetical protein